MRRLRSVPAWVGFSLLLCGLTLACGPGAAPASPTAVAADPFAVVRATSQAAYRAGKDLLDKGDLTGCLAIDTAKTNDPDNDPEIQRALEQCLTAITQAVTPTAGAPTPQQRTIVVATVPAAGAATNATPVVPGAASTSPPAAAPTSATLAPVAANNSTPSAAAKPGAGSPAPAPNAQPAPSPVAAGTLAGVVWRDPQGRFTVSTPVDWSTVDQPLPLFGTGAVQFRDPTARAEFDVGVDSAAKVVSPELYAASMEIAMQQQVPGYASEQVLPGSTAGQPSIRRVFTFTQRDAAGRDLQARGFQVVVLKGSTPYILSGSSPAEQFQQYLPTFDQMVESFRFS